MGVPHFSQNDGPVVEDDSEVEEKSEFEIEWIRLIPLLEKMMDLQPWLEEWKAAADADRVLTSSDAGNRDIMMF